MPARRPDPPPYEVDLTPMVAAGTLAWLVALVVLAAVTGGGHGWWLGTCGAGAGLGLLGLTLLRRRARRPADRQL